MFGRFGTRHRVGSEKLLIVAMRGPGTHQGENLKSISKIMNTLPERIDAFRKDQAIAEAAKAAEMESQRKASFEAGREWALNKAEVSDLESLDKAKRGSSMYSHQWDRAVERLFRNGITSTFDPDFAEGALSSYKTALAKIEN